MPADVRCTDDVIKPEDFGDLKTLQHHYEDVHADDGGGDGGDGGDGGASAASEEAGGSRGGEGGGGGSSQAAAAAAAAPRPPRGDEKVSALKATYEAALRASEAATASALEAAAAANTRATELGTNLKEEAWYSATLKDQLELEKMKVASLGADRPDIAATATIEATATLQAEVLQLKKDLDAAQTEARDSEARYIAADTELAAVAAKFSAQAQELLGRPQKAELEALLTEVNLLKSSGCKDGDADAVVEGGSETLAAMAGSEAAAGAGGGGGGGGGRRDDSGVVTATLERKLSDSLVIVDAKVAEVNLWKARYQTAVARAEKQEARASMTSPSGSATQVGALERECAIKDGELAEIRASLASKTEEHSNAEKEKAGAVAKAEGLDDAVKELKELIELNKEEKGKLRAELREGHKLEAEISNELNRRETAATAVEAALEKAEIKLAEQCAAFDTTVEKLSSEKRQLRERVSAMEMSLIEQGEQMTMMSENDSGRMKMEQEATQEVNLLLDKAELLEQSKVALEAQVVELEGENQTLKTIEKQLKTENTTVKLDRARLTKAVGVAEASVAELEQAKINIENDMGAMAQKTRQSQKDSKALAQLVEQSKLLFVKQKVQLQGQLAATKTALDEMQAELAKTVLERDSAKSSVAADIVVFRDRAEAEATAKRTVERTLADTRKQLTEEIQQLHSDLGLIQQQLTDSESKIRSLTATVDSITVEKQLAEGSVRDSEAEKGGLLERVVAEEKKYSDLAAKFNTLVQELKERTSAMEELAEENQELVKKINEVSSRQWESSSGIKQCKGCNSNFTVKRRKHHCRNCGQVFCNSCTPHSAKTTTSKKAVRVCEPW